VSESFTIAYRFRGPETSGNGGYTAEAPVVLGRMAAVVPRPIPVGAGGVAVGWPLGRDGRKLHSGTALFAADGTLLGYARQTWIVLG